MSFLVTVLLIVMPFVALNGKMKSDVKTGFFVVVPIAILVCMVYGVLFG